MEVNPNMTFAQAVVISQACVQMKKTCEGVVNSIHATPEEKELARMQIATINTILFSSQKETT